MIDIAEQEERFQYFMNDWQKWVDPTPKAEVRMKYQTFQEGIEELVKQRSANEKLVLMLQQVIEALGSTLLRAERAEKKLVTSERKLMRLKVGK